MSLSNEVLKRNWLDRLGLKITEAKPPMPCALSCSTSGPTLIAPAEGATNQAVADQLGIWPQTVAKWRGRFVRERLEGLTDEPRPGRPRTITDQQVEQVLTKTLEEPPPHGVLLLISHSPGRLLPTIRSRCRVVPLGRASGRRRAHRRRRARLTRGGRCDDLCVPDDGGRPR